MEFDPTIGASTWSASMLALQRRRQRSFLSALLASGLAAGAVAQETYFVAPPSSGGSDSNPGSSAAPWATLQHAADRVTAGDTVIVRAGTYAGFNVGEPHTGTPG